MQHLTPEQQAAFDRWIAAWRAAWDEARPEVKALRVAQRSNQAARDAQRRADDWERAAHANLMHSDANRALDDAQADLLRLRVPFPGWHHLYLFDEEV